MWQVDAKSRSTRQYNAQTHAGRQEDRSKNAGKQNQFDILPFPQKLKSSMNISLI